MAPWPLRSTGASCTRPDRNGPNLRSLEPWLRQYQISSAAGESGDGVVGGTQEAHAAGDVEK
jgi:hypothetical protein